MNKANLSGMKLHQGISFHPAMMRVPDSPVLFWPGCALLNLDGEILRKTLSVLQRAEPQMALAACCCGQPTRYLLPNQFAQRQKKITDLLQKHGVQRIYTACPNCTLQLQELVDFEILPIWPLLAEMVQPRDLAPLPQGKSFVWHDPCPTRPALNQPQAAREVPETCGCSFIEPEHTGCSTICCGNFHMTHTLRPEVSAQMRQRRLSEFPADRVILSSCEGCLGAFRSEGRQAMHLLELLFGQSSSHSWGNRIRTTLSIR